MDRSARLGLGYALVYALVYAALAGGRTSVAAE
jgi:hypothetical protein